MLSLHLLYTGLQRWIKKTGNFRNTWELGEFPKNLGIRGIPQKPGNLGKFSEYLKNFSNSKAFEKFLIIKKWNPRFLKESGEFPKYFLKCPAIWEISQIPRGLENSPNIQSYKKVPKYNLGNLLDGVLFFNYSKFLKCLVIWEIS